MNDRVYVGADWNDDYEKQVSALRERLERYVENARGVVTKIVYDPGQPRC